MPPFQRTVEVALRGGVLVLLVAAVAAAAYGIPKAARAAAPLPFRSSKAAVVSDHPHASAAGLALLRSGGNAVDAACATALALGVVNPASSGIGGGGFAVVYLTKERRVFALDFRERAPAAATPGMFVRDGKADPALSAAGGRAVAVPGEVRGLGEMVRRWGARPFRDCVGPAQRLARSGAPVSWRVADEMTAWSRFLPGGRPLPEGALMRRPDLAGTLGKLLRFGPDAFYTGAIADDIVKAVRDAGGVLTHQDLARYTATDRAPLETAYRGLRVYSMPPPSSGGIAVSEVLGSLAALAARGHDLGKLGRGSSAHLHVVAESFKHAFADRARHLGDADFVPVPTAHLTGAAYHRDLAARIVPDRVLPRESYGTPEAGDAGDAGAQPAKGGGTSHLSVIDADGNAVALTTTINLSFGAKLVAGKTGIILNDEMDDFSLQPGVPNAFGLIGNDENAVAPGKRPLSSMTPTLVLEGDRVKIAVGAAGGPKIITATAQILLNVIDFKLDAMAANAAPRIHHQWIPEVLSLEADVPQDVVAALERRGHRTKVVPRLATANLLVRTERGLEAAADPRGAGAVAGY